MNAFLKGVLGGAAATASITLAQLLLMKPLPAPTPEGGPDEWTPQYMTGKMLEAVSPEGESPSDDALLPLSLAGHVAYGTLSGGVYGLWRGERGGGPASGIAYGLGLYLIGYGGWVPAMGLLRPPHREEPNREIRQILAHVVYGATLGAAYGWLMETEGSRD